MQNKVVLIILDGLGLSNKTKGNAFKLANTPTFDSLFKEYPNSILQASGEFVGLPKNQMGNSEVGHLNIGAGRIVFTGLSLINNACKTGDFEKNKVFLNTFENVKKSKTTLHFIGLLSKGGVHSSEEHLFKLLDMAHNNNLSKVSVHVLGDGRDVAPKSIIDSLNKLEAITKKYNYKVASIGGRFYGMDRDKNFDRVEEHYQALLGLSSQKFDKPIDYVKSQYEANITDEFLIPASSKDANFIQDNDSIIFFNFRPDRARELTHFLIGSNLYNQQPPQKVKIQNFVSMMKYEGIDTKVAFEEMQVLNPIGKAIEDNNLSQLRLAETQKYAHVTYFMDGGNDIIYKNSKRIMIPSLKVANYASEPQMSAEKITDALIKEAANFDLTIVNYANTDMVGHTGDLKATIKAIEVIDKQIKKILQWAQKNKVTIFITADHGNAEEMLDENNLPATKHTSNPVMLITSDKNCQLKDGKLANVAPTILDYLNLPKPLEMTEESLLVK